MSEIAIYSIIKTIHILSSTILFGTGLGIAFFMWWANKTSDIQAKLYAARTTVLADFLFTTPSIILQPLSGLYLVHSLGYSIFEPWLLATYILYGIAGICWLPVVWIQIQLRNILMEAVQNNTALPNRYHKLFNIWFALGWPAFMSLIIIFYLMVNKPNLLDLYIF